MKKKISALLLSVLLCGCQNIGLPANPVNGKKDGAELKLVIPVGSGDICYEVAQELARRATDFSGNHLEVTITLSENIWAVIESGEADLVVCENSRLTADAQKKNALSYPQPQALSEEAEQVLPGQLTGEAAMFAMLEYPYFFRDQDCVLGGGNDGDFLAALNHSLPEWYSLELKRLSYCGEYHWLSNDGDGVETHRMKYGVDDILLEQLAAGKSIREPLSYLDDGGLYLYEADVTDEDLELQGNAVLLSGGRQMLLDIFVKPETLETLDESQQAAVEEAIVYSGGYSRTLADERMEQALKRLESNGVAIKEVDVDEWYNGYQNLYLSGNDEVNVELTKLLEEKTERFH